MSLSVFLFSLVVAPVTADIGWMSGSWSCEIEGGTFEETWSTSLDGKLQGFGRHEVGGKVVFVEFLAIEETKDRGTVMFIHLGSISREEHRVAEFKLVESSVGTAAFEREVENDFPKRITYTRVGDGLTCVLVGREDGKDMKQVYDFRPVKM